MHHFSIKFVFNAKRIILKGHSLVWADRAVKKVVAWTFNILTALQKELIVSWKLSEIMVPELEPNLSLVKAKCLSSCNRWKWKYYYMTEEKIPKHLLKLVYFLIYE